MAKKCRLCGNDVPDERWGSSWYCSEEHKYEAKKKRSNDRYYSIKKQFDKVSKNELILKSLLVAFELGAQINISDLEKAGLDMSISTGEVADSGGGIWKMIGNHAYHIDPKTQLVRLWKQK